MKNSEVPLFMYFKGFLILSKIYCSTTFHFLFHLQKKMQNESRNNSDGGGERVRERKGVWKGSQQF